MYSRDNKIMRKLLGKATPDNSTDTTAPGIGITSAPNYTQTFRPSSSQYTVYDAGYPIFSVDAASDRRSAVLGSRHVLKTVLFDGLDVTEGVDIRAAISAASNPMKTSSSSTISDQLSVKDAKWCKDSVIFTACANGKIFSYDVVRIASGGSPLDCVQMREDSRQVNTVDVNPHWASTLLSGSQDGYVRCFDIRAPVQSRAGGMMTYKPRAAFKCNADGVRHAKWSPKDGTQLACATEAGIVMKWDVRKPTMPLLRITAHEKACSSISWHPDGNHLISGGWDQKCAVWDLSKNADKRQKPKHVFTTPAPVAAVAWRPPLWSASAQGKRAAQVAVSYDDASTKRYGIKVAQIWDLSRPSMPFKELDWFSTPPASLMWIDQDLLWAVGEEGKFHQCDIAYAPKVIDRLSSSSIAFSGRGDVAMFLDERPRQRPRPSVVHHQQETTAVSRQTYGSSPTAPMLSISRSDSEEDVMGSFLAPKRKAGGGRSRRASVRSIPALSTTPPSGSGTGEAVTLGLEQSVKLTGVFKSPQAMAVGRVPSASKESMYQYLSQLYLETLQRELPQKNDSAPLVDRVTKIMERFALSAEKVGQFRLAQTWRILSYSMSLLLKRRAQFHLESRLGQLSKKEALPKAKEPNKLSLNYLDVVMEDQSPQARRPSAISATTERGGGGGGSSLHGRSLLSEEIESTSNSATPLARPYDAEGSNPDNYRAGKKLTPVIELDNFSLPPAATSTLMSTPRKRLDSVPLSTHSRESDSTQVSNTEGYDFYDADAINYAIDVPEPQGGQQHAREGVQSIDYGADPGRPPNVSRHGSDDSFAQMFSMSENSKKAWLASLSASTTDAGDSASYKSKFEPVDEREEHDQQQQHQDEEDQGEYESRIRGKELDQSGELLPHASRNHRRRSLMPVESPEEVFQISQTTQDSDLTQSEEPSQQSQSFASEELPFEDHAPLHVGIKSASPQKEEPEPQPLDGTPTVIESDYLPWPNDPTYTELMTSAASQKSNMEMLPHDPYTLIARTLDFELRTSVLNAAAIVLLIKPLVPKAIIDSHRAASILRSYHGRLTSMRLFVEAALLRNLCIKGWPDGLPDWGDNHTAIFGPAQQSVKCGFLCPTCRKPREIDPEKGPSALWQCDRCKTHMAPCAVCGHRENSAATATTIPLADGLGKQHAAAAAAAGDEIMSLWWYCPGCSHGGHATCIQGWHAPHGLDADESHLDEDEGSGGCCPLDGCGHACLPGNWRDEKATLRAEEVSRAAVEKARGGPGTPRKGSASAGASPTITPMSGGNGLGGGFSTSSSSFVRGDGVEVPQSRAVESVRETLAGEQVWSGGGGGGGGGVHGGGGSGIGTAASASSTAGGTISRVGSGSTGTGILSSSPGRSNMERSDRERRKSVKFVPTAER